MVAFGIHGGQIKLICQLHHNDWYTELKISLSLPVKVQYKYEIRYSFYIPL